MEFPTNAQHYLYFPFCNLISFKSSGKATHNVPFRRCHDNRRVIRDLIKRYPALRESSVVVYSLHGKQVRAKNSPSFLFINSASLV